MPPPRPHPLAVSRAARIADRLISAAWRSGVTRKPLLEPEYLWRIGAKGFERADETGGRSEDDATDFRDRLEKLCQSLSNEARLNALGHTMAYGQLTAAIRKRHALGRLWRRRPELAETPIAPPIVVLGQMRSGTTRVHRLLAADPAHAGTRFCDSIDPVPRLMDLRPLKAAAALAIARRINPWLDTLHPFGATRVDEEIGWLSGALSPCAFEAQWRIPSFVRWSEQRDATPVYREFARTLRTDAAARPNASVPRVLKCPQYTEDVAALAECFADARFVITTREHGAVLESAVSLVASQSAFQSDALDLAEIRSEWKRKLGLRETRLAEAMPTIDGRTATVSFEALDCDWLAAIAQVYRTLGIPLSQEARQVMTREQRAAARSPHRQHAAALGRFAKTGS
jgi:hypothetical protein